MHKRDIIVIGASAGGVEALIRLCGDFPADMAASVFVVQHLSPSARSFLAQVLARSSRLRVTAAVDGDTIEPGHIYVAVPDRHLLLRTGRILIRRGPQENRSRPSIDALFRSAAVAYGSRVIGVVLTGLLDDGTEGLLCIKQAGGTSVVQDPNDAAWPSMPQHALAEDHVDHCLPLAGMGDLLARLCRLPAGECLPLPGDVVAEARISEQEIAVTNTAVVPPGQPSALGCPQCGGVLNEMDDNKGPRFRCRIGHAFTSAGLEAAQNDEMERALAVAVRTHRDRTVLFRRMEVSARSRGMARAAERWQQAAAEAERFAVVLEQALAALSKPLDAVEALASAGDQSG